MHGNQNQIQPISRGHIVWSINFCERVLFSKFDVQCTNGELRRRYVVNQEVLTVNGQKIELTAARTGAEVRSVIAARIGDMLAVQLGRASDDLDVSAAAEK